jgi:hypothetical protein
MDWGLEAGGLFGVLGGVLFTYRHFQLRNAGKASTAWPTANGRILVSSITEKESWDNGTRYVDHIPTVEYAYDIADKSYLGKSIAHKVFSSLTRLQAQTILDKYPLSATIAVHYKPSDPSNAVLEPGMQQSLMLLILGAIFLPVGLLMMWAGANG